MDRWVDRWGVAVTHRQSGGEQMANGWTDADWTDTDGRVGGQMGRWMRRQVSGWLEGRTSG